MKIFLSYASQDRAVADTINHALLEQGHDVFFDRDDLPPGEQYHSSIRRAIEKTDLFVFLVSEHAIDVGSYTLNELDMATTRWPRPSGRLLPVLLRPIPLDQLPAVITAVSVLQTPGNIAAAAAQAVHEIARRRRRAARGRIGAGVLSAALVATVVFWLARRARALPSDIVGRDGAASVLVPAGPFMMGDGEQSPTETRELGAFYIDKFEVTTGRYATYLAAHPGIRPPDDWEQLDLTTDSELPVVGVDWSDAHAYCMWVKRRLPTDAEWEKAARGTDGRRYPWGDAFPTPALANFENVAPGGYTGGLAPVGSHPAGQSPYGVHDMAGNTNEWVEDWFTDREAPPVPPTSPAGQTERIVRGGGRMDGADRIRSTLRYRDVPTMRNEQIGFRCASDG